MERLARTFKALADPTRLRILNLLLAGPGCVCELQAVLDLPQSLISRHLAYLRNAGLVDDERQGMRVLYRLRTEGSLGDDLQLFLSKVLPGDERLRRAAESWRGFHQDSEGAEERMAS
jgi:ArsR family transcriptional regulator, arsenate/arsenite/antimonite-responsive transcriptional repressor